MAQLTLGVIADTHVPDRARALHPAVLEVFRRAGVREILHAGDVCAPHILAQLAQVAPVQAVGGNRDWLQLRRLPPALHLVYGQTRLALVHGHGGLRGYLGEKLGHLLHGYQQARYQRLLLKAFPRADVIIFGHSHRSLNLWVGSQLLFNPGSACCPELRSDPPSVGLLHLPAGAPVVGEIVPLTD